MPCLFCEIVAKRAPAKIIYQDEVVTAFRDIRKHAPTHVLIVPNEHLESLDDVRDDRTIAYAAECLKVAAEIARRERLTQGYRLVTNVGPDAGQSVFHLHFHLLGGRKMGWPPG